MRKYFLSILVVSLFSMLLLPSCQKIGLEKKDIPSCIKNKIRKGQVSKEIVAVTEWKLENGEKLYLFVPDCCDRFIDLYDSKCKRICAPSGGFTGKGDGQCSVDYSKMDIKETLVWEKKR